MFDISDELMIPFVVRVGIAPALTSDRVIVLGFALALLILV